MRISSLIESATRIMARLAELPPGTTLSAERLSDLENISRDYVDQILQRLRRGALVTSQRGAQGGYCLARPAGEISVGMTVRAVEGRIFEAVSEKYCADAGRSCHRTARCGIRPVWERLGEVIEKYLDVVTLDQVASRGPAGRATREAVASPLSSSTRRVDVKGTR